MCNYFLNSESYYPVSESHGSFLYLRMEMKENYT
jgi:hypothetical protein